MRLTTMSCRPPPASSANWVLLAWVTPLILGNEVAPPPPSATNGTSGPSARGLAALEIDLERHRLLAVDPAEAPVGQDDAEPVGGVAIDDREDLAVIGAIELAIGEAGAGAHGGARDDDAELRIGLGAG